MCPGVSPPKWMLALPGIAGCASPRRRCKLIQLYEKNGIGPERILIKLAATWEGIRAAEELEQSGINCNLTLLFSFAPGPGVRSKRASFSSPFVGRIYDWYQKHQPQSAYQVDSDPGVVSVRQIYQYYQISWL